MRQRIVKYTAGNDNSHNMKMHLIYLKKRSIGIIKFLHECNYLSPLEILAILIIKRNTSTWTNWD